MIIFRLIQSCVSRMRGPTFAAQFVVAMDLLDLLPEEKTIVKMRYIDLLATAEHKHNKGTLFFNILTNWILLSNILVTALLSLTKTEVIAPDSRDGVFWLIWGMSMSLTLANKWMYSFNIHRRYVFNNILLARLRNEGWTFISGVGLYEEPNMRRRFLLFCERVERISLATTQELSKFQAEQAGLANSSNNNINNHLNRIPNAINSATASSPADSPEKRHRTNGSTHISIVPALNLTGLSSLGDNVVSTTRESAKDSARESFHEYAKDSGLREPRPSPEKRQSDFNPSFIAEPFAKTYKHSPLSEQRNQDESEKNKTPRPNDEIEQRSGENYVSVGPPPYLRRMPSSVRIDHNPNNFAFSDEYAPTRKKASSMSAPTTPSQIMKYPSEDNIGFAPTDDAAAMPTFYGLQRSPNRQQSEIFRPRSIGMQLMTSSQNKPSPSTLSSNFGSPSVRAPELVPLSRTPKRSGSSDDPSTPSPFRIYSASASGTPKADE